MSKLRTPGLRANLGIEPRLNHLQVFVFLATSAQCRKDRSVFVAAATADSTHCHAKLCSASNLVRGNRNTRVLRSLVRRNRNTRVLRSLVRGKINTRVRRGIACAQNSSANIPHHHAGRGDTGDSTNKPKQQAAGLDNLCTNGSNAQTVSFGRLRCQGRRRLPPLQRCNSRRKNKQQHQQTGPQSRFITPDGDKLLAQARRCAPRERSGSGCGRTHWRGAMSTELA